MQPEGKPLEWLYPYSYRYFSDLKILVILFNHNSVEFYKIEEDCDEIKLIHRTLPKENL